jgi:hypothetical protein
MASVTDLWHGLAATLSAHGSCPLVAEKSAVALKRLGQGLAPVCARRSWHYRCRVQELIAPTTGLRTAWLEAHAEWGPGQHEDGFGLHPSDEVNSRAGFGHGYSGYWTSPIRRSRWTTARCVAPIDGSSRAIACSAGSRCGTAAATTCSGPAMSVSASGRPRGRGLATWALGRMLEEARMLDLDRVLAVCAVDNVASARTIERCGGVFEGVRDTRFGPARHSWIEL